MLELDASSLSLTGGQVASTDSLPPGRGVEAHRGLDARIPGPGGPRPPTPASTPWAPRTLANAPDLVRRRETALQERSVGGRLETERAALAWRGLSEVAARKRREAGNFALSILGRAAPHPGGLEHARLLQAFSAARAAVGVTHDGPRPFALTTGLGRQPR